MNPAPNGSLRRHATNDKRRLTTAAGALVPDNQNTTTAGPRGPVLLQEGFGEIVLVEREPNGALDTHTHPFEAKALILSGEIRITTGDTATTYRVGDVFHLTPNEPHTESYGPEGVRYLVGRR